MWENRRKPALVILASAGNDEDNQFFQTYKNVFRFNISMYDIERVKMLNGRANIL